MYYIKFNSKESFNKDYAIPFKGKVFFKYAIQLNV